MTADACFGAENRASLKTINSEEGIFSPISQFKDQMPMAGLCFVYADVCYQRTLLKRFLKYFFGGKIFI